MRNRIAAGKVGAAFALSLCTAMPSPAMAQASNQARSYDIPAGPLGSALNQLGRAARLTISYDPASVRGKTTSGVRDARSVSEALSQLLRGTGLEAHSDSAGGFVVRVSKAKPVERKRAARRDAPSTVSAVRPAPRPDSDPAVEDVVVTGFTSPYARSGLFGDQAVLDTPFSMTSYTEDAFDALQARTVTDVFALDPSIRSNLSASSESEQYVLRGFPLFASEVAVDGLYGMVPGRRNPIEPYAKVEVFRGPNALINGVAPFGNIGGMINLIPKRAQARRTLDATALYMSDGHVGGNVDLGARFGDEQQLGARLNAAHYAGDLALNFTNRRADVASLALDYKAGGVRLTADFLYTSELIRGQDHHLTAAAGFQIPDAPKSTVNYGQPWTRTNSQTKSAILGASYEFLPGTTVSARYGYLDFDEYYRYTLGTLTSATGNFTSRFSLFGSRSVDETGEIALRSKFQTGPFSHSFVAAATTLYIKTFGNLPFQTPPTLANNIYKPVHIARPAAMFTDAVAAQFDDLRHSNDRKLRGIAIADTISALDDHVRLTLGVRHQNVKMTNFDRATGKPLTDYDESKTTYAAGLVVKPKSFWSLYGSFSQGLTPGLFAPPGSANTGTVFAPFVSTQYEFGSKVELANSMSASLAFFRINQPFGYVQPSTNLYVLNGDAINKGIEFNLSGKPLAGLSLLGGILYSAAEQQGTAGGLTDGKRPIGIPEWQINLFGEYEPAMLPGFALNATFIHTSKQFYDAENLRPIDGWNRFDLGLRYGLNLGGNRYILRANVENVTANSYWQSTSRGFLTRGSPRTARLSLEAKF